MFTFCAGFLTGGIFCCILVLLYNTDNICP